MIINHAAVENNWFLPEIYNNATTLILGSFNPFNPNGDNADYFYGRPQNYFWKVIGSFLHNDQNFYFNNFQAKCEVMLEKRFCFYDLIDHIDVTSVDEVALNNFVNNKIFSNFPDSTLFTTNTNYQGSNINIVRTYNQEIINSLNQGNIENVIHTLGNNRINHHFVVNPLENHLGHNGFQGFFNNILDQNGIINPISFSPSARAVHVGGQVYLDNLTQWLIENLNL
ncbi:MAG: hypothetical protein U0V04_16010 [Spirosomataceae bacterium]|jgi:hypothetical protein